MERERYRNGRGLGHGVVVMCAPAAIPIAAKVVGGLFAAKAVKGAAKALAPSSPDVNVTQQDTTTTETVDQGAQRARTLMRRRAAALGGRASTMITGPQGATATGQMKSLLGS